MSYDHAAARSLVAAHLAAYPHGLTAWDVARALGWLDSGGRPIMTRAVTVLGELETAGLVRHVRESPRRITWYPAVQEVTDGRAVFPPSDQRNPARDRNATVRYQRETGADHV